MAREPEFELKVPAGADLGQTLIVGIADFGVAGLTAVDHLTKHDDSQQIGHVETRNLPDVTPFSNGVPRHPIRVYKAEQPDLLFLISEVFLPVWVADPLTGALFDWIDGTNLEEVTILYGAPFPHSEEEHVVYHVGNETFRDRHFGEGNLDPLPGGFFDGIVGELMIKGLDDESPSVGVLVTPAHFPGPDIDGALRLIEGIEATYSIEVDKEELKETSEQMKRHYQELAERMQAIRDGDQTLQYRDFPEDRMYM